MAVGYIPHQPQQTSLLMQALPQQFYYLPPMYTGPATPGSAAAPTQPASPTASASDLQILIASIRPAQDGQVIISVPIVLGN